MRKIIVLAALATVAACSQTETAPEPEATAETTAPAPAEEVMAADGGPAYGKFKITHEDGSVDMEDVKPDGTWTSTAADGTVTTGTWVQKPGEYCVTASTEGAVEECYPETIDASGKWVSTDTKDGSTSIVERVAE